MAKRPEGQKHVKSDGNNVRAPRNTQIEAQDTQNMKNCLWGMVGVMDRSEDFAASVWIEEAGGRAGK